MSAVVMRAFLVVFASLAGKSLASELITELRADMTEARAEVTASCLLQRSVSDVMPVELGDAVADEKIAQIETQHARGFPGENESQQLALGTHEKKSEGTSRPEKYGLLEETDPNCVTSAWPNKKEGIACFDCTVLVLRFQELYETCHRYCTSLGRGCSGAWEGEEANGNCFIESEKHCLEFIQSSAAVCECRGTLQDVAPPAHPVGELNTDGTACRRRRQCPAQEVNTDGTACRRRRQCPGAEMNTDGTACRRRRECPR